ncbi:NACHT domain-containing protein [Amycolatopsis balhimycina DSM 5908]|uniref:NACHT domain-containing protein n=1 Tax=Amycolatopsis balhimycina DSM 5908 TaxID=1081091 RepID=A0A428X625_AMYBA|nr:NACHT domain-containing protein [Amycolatopsis balhimycina]RSM50780.1 NACHT domain-containing protein [Amycolatopsis balhimycina DSM 5908]
MGISGWLVTGVLSLGASVLFVPRALWGRWRERLVERLDRGLRRRVSRFGRRYREFVVSGLRFVDLKGLATVGFHTPELDEVFVDVSLGYRAPHQVPDGLLDHLPVDTDGRHSIGDFLDREQPAVLAVIGGPGGGKTTLLRHTARAACRERGNRRRTVPILLYLRDHVEEIVRSPAVDLPTLVRGVLGRYAGDEPPGWFEQRLKSGECVVLLDGLDEVARQEDRRRVADWVERATEQYPANDFVLTSRPQGYRAATVAGASVLQVRSFTDEQVTTFIRGWYRAVAKRTSVPEDAAGDLLRRLDRSPGLSALTVNPLLLTMIANVHHYRGALPGSRADLYGEICQVMLWRRQEAKRLPSELSGDKKELLLRGLAFAMMQRRVRDLARADVLAEFRAVLRRMSTSVDENRFLDEASAYGLVIERESGMYAFAHLTFQESLAAGHIRAKNLVDVLTGAVDDPWWRETTLLYAAQSDADPVVAACLASGTVTALSLATACADLSGDLAPELRARLDDQTGSTADERRAAVAVVGHFGDVIHTADGGRICANPVSSAVYELFRDATGTRPPDGRPAEPVSGVRASDASAFVRWANALPETPGYRLPTEQELADPGVERMLTTVAGVRPWVTRGPAIVLWTPPGSAHPNLIDAETFGGHLDDDLERLTPGLARMLAARLVPAIRDAGKEVNHFALRDVRPVERNERLSAYAALVQELLGADHRAEAPRDEDSAVARDLGLDKILGPEIDDVLPVLSSFATQLSHTARIDRNSTFVNYDPEFWDRGKMREEYAEQESSQSEVMRLIEGLPANLVSGDAPARALSEPLTAAFRSPRPANWHQVFRTEFTRVARVAECGGVVSLDDLADHVRDGGAAVTKATPTPWANAVCRKLADNALPVFERRTRLTPVAATAIRVAALCLAVEADTHCPGPIGDQLRAVATGTTLLERRLSGRAPTTETVVLASMPMTLGP